MGNGQDSAARTDAAIRSRKDQVIRMDKSSASIAVAALNAGWVILTHCTDLHVGEGDEASGETRAIA